MPQDALPAADDARYLAVLAHDARFDGCFFTGVTSTGIYCRPVCRVRAPKRENCRFFEHAAQAERAGFRPCLRCRPELAPRALAWSMQDASRLLAEQAARWLDDPEGMSLNVEHDSRKAAPTMTTLAARLGVSDRHVRRIFEAHLGVSPVQYLQTRRLLNAKQLLTDTSLPVTQVAYLSGYASVRRFNAAFLTHYGLNPTQLRREGAVPTKGSSAVKLGYRPPYDVDAMLGFFSKRQIAGIESVTTDKQTTTMGKTFRVDFNGKTYSGWLRFAFDTERCHLLLTHSDSLRDVLPLVIHRVRAAFDLDANPQAIDQVLCGSFPGMAGLRLPGALDGFELAVRAVLGQQITVAAARTLTQRLVERFGEPIETPWPELNRLFPRPAVLAQAVGDALGALGIVRQRQAAIIALAQGVADHRLLLNGSADVPSTVAALKALPGIGDWTAQYIAMRALRWPDAFPAGDVALHKALGVKESKHPARAAEAASRAWQPWRSYAVIRAWSQLS